jgi:23S rRNA pseudouridine2604 synthase
MLEQRINQYLASQNIASRREADELIEKGLVFINGKKAILGQKVNLDKDKVEVNKRQNSYVYYAYNKPKGIVTTTPQKGEIDIVHFTKFPKKVFPVGRLDKDSEGLIILTDDRKLTKKLLEPNSNKEKEYMVEINEKVTPEFISFLKNGVRLEDGYLTKKCSANKIAPNKFSIILTEGKNRQIRRMVSVFGYNVLNLRRIRIGKVYLRDMRPGEFISVKESQL